jgi:diguanylate cyclase (GGDEF)-like protein
VAVIDLDHFKNLNDRHGHAVGDIVLRKLAQLLLGWFRGEDIVARWGGEEFLVCMYGMSREDGVHRIAELLEKLRLQLDLFPEQTDPVTFSAGVAEYPCDGEDLASLYRSADSALYLAKLSGRNRVCGHATSRPVARLKDCPPDLAPSLRAALETRGYEVVGEERPDDTKDLVFTQTGAAASSVVPLEREGDAPRRLGKALAQLRAVVADVPPR